MTDLSPTVQELIAEVQRDKQGAKNLSRAERRAKLARQLRECAERRNLSIRRLATEMGTSTSQAQRVLSSATPNVTLDTILRAADAMGVEVECTVRDPFQRFAPGTLVVLNSKTQPLHEHKGWLVPGRRCRIVEIDFINKRKRKCWYRVELLGKSGVVIGTSKVPSNWLDVAPTDHQSQ